MGNHQRWPPVREWGAHSLGGVEMATIFSAFARTLLTFHGAYMLDGGSSPA